MSTRSTAERLASVVRRFAGRRVCVVGDLVVDEFVFGDIARVSREAPVLVLDERRRESVPGGAGNCVANLRALGARPLPVGAVGRDGTGQRLLAGLRGRRVSTAGIQRPAGYATPCKSRILAGGVHTRRQQIVRIDRGAERGDLPRGLRSAVLRGLDAALVHAEGLLVADYGYGVAAPDAALLRRLRSAMRRGLPVTVDSRARVAAFGGVTICSPNQEELEIAAGGSRLDDSGLVQAGRELLSRTANEAVLVTRGAAGMTLLRPRRRALTIPAYGSDEVADVTGAGDTVTAVLTLALVAGAGVEDAARLANYAAGLVVRKAGTATISTDELIAAVHEDAAP